MKKNKESLISIVIPVYNTPSDSIQANINSILSVDCNNYEIILVDDGSENDCAKLLDTIAENDSKIKVIHQKNSGVSNARNTGIKVADSPYIAFVDADDTVAKKFLIEAENYIREYTPDIIFGTLEYVPKRSIKQNNGVVEIFENQKIDDVKFSLLGIKPRNLDYRVLGTPCARIYKTELARASLFPERVPLCEDQIFNRRVLNKASKIIVVPNIWYYYIQNDFSAMHTTMKKDYYKMAKPYWDELLAINSVENEYIKEKLRIASLGLYYTVIKKDYIDNPTKLTDKIKKLTEIAEHPLILDATESLSLFTNTLTKEQKLGLLFMKLKFILLVYWCQCLKRKKEGNKNE